MGRKTIDNGMVEAHARLQDILTNKQKGTRESGIMVKDGDFDLNVFNKSIKSTGFGKRLELKNLKK